MGCFGSKEEGDRQGVSSAEADDPSSGFAKADKHKLKVAKKESKKLQEEERKRRDEEKRQTGRNRRDRRRSKDDSNIATKVSAIEYDSDDDESDSGASAERSGSRVVIEQHSSSLLSNGAQKSTRDATGGTELPELEGYDSSWDSAVEHNGHRGGNGAVSRHSKASARLNSGETFDRDDVSGTHRQGHGDVSVSNRSLHDRREGHDSDETAASRAHRIATKDYSDDFDYDDPESSPGTRFRAQGSDASGNDFSFASPATGELKRG